MASLIVSALMKWLSNRLGIWLPSLADVQPWPWLVKLWSYVVPGGTPSGDPPWTIEVEGSVSLLDVFELEQITVFVHTGSTPDPVHITSTEV